MSNTNTGGPAFPRPFSVDDVDPDISYPAHVGMHLHDYLAAKAMQSFIANVGWKVDQKCFEEIAEGSYRMAYAMLKAREQ
jgi:hypothetical protein